MGRVHHENHIFEGITGIIGHWSFPQCCHLRNVMTWPISYSSIHTNVSVFKAILWKFLNRVPHMYVKVSSISLVRHKADKWKSEARGILEKNCRTWVPNILDLCLSRSAERFSLSDPAQQDQPVPSFCEFSEFQLFIGFSFHLIKCHLFFQNLEDSSVLLLDPSI